MRPGSALRCIAVCVAFAVFALFAQPALRAQSAAASSSSIASELKPPDVSADWKQLIGIYGQGGDQRVLLESNGKLWWKFSTGRRPDWSVELKQDGSLNVTPPGSGAASVVLAPERSSDGSVVSLKSGKQVLSRVDAGADPSHFYHVTPNRPLEQLLSAALRASPPAEKGPFLKAELVEIGLLDPAIHLDIRYAKANNFLSTPIYPEARAFLQRPAAEALVRVLRKLQPLGYGLLIHDAYRPWYVTKIFWDATPPEGRRFVADPAKGSKHNRGCAVDITLYDLATGEAIQMPGLYDEMSPRSYPAFPGGTSLQRWHRDLLRRAMESEGFSVNEDEWWHFDYKEWKHYAIGNEPFEKLGRN